ncbi:sister chromatid separation protein [Niveomyces insectorum RCEF 264]|uniref:Sister chromatid separation protein n=1 Tax=Niveomyces insectorum RCEF 264 TaxID=1081102 RepID=A0A167MUW8_9HYPO|nr:sister chromatid separation protein [Niveomyces insectorum RCEF 264]
MSDSESVDYLQPGFDPSSLTNPRLRSILVTYNVHYASNAKKPELVELFSAHVAPQASKILARRARAKRSSMGIVDAADSSQSHSQSSASFDEHGSQQQRRRRTPARSSQHIPVHEEEEEEEEERESDDETKKSRRSQQRQHHRRAGDEDEEDDHNLRRQRRSSPRKRQVRSTSFQPATSTTTGHPTASDTDTGPDLTHARPPSRRARTKTPQVKAEPTEDGDGNTLFRCGVDRSVSGRSHGTFRPSSADEDADVPFTDENPFQSGSSPLTAPSTAQKRRTSGRDSTGRTRVSTGDGAAPAAASAAVSATPKGHASARSRVRDSSSTFKGSSYLSPEPEHPEADDYDALEPGEEFTPEEQLELAQEEALLRQRNAVGARRPDKTSTATARAAASRKRKRSVLSSLVTPLWVLTLTLLGAYGAWYRQEKVAVGFCGLGRPAVPLLADQLDWLYQQAWVPDWVRDLEAPSGLRVLFEPQCEPCPSHAFCFFDFTVRCENGYIAKAHPLALGGLVPLPPTCEPDGERARRVKSVADKAIEALRDRRAQWECGDLVDDDGQVPDGPAIDEPVLKEVISAKRSKKMSKEEFDDLWTAAIGDIESRDEVEAEPSAIYAATDSGTVPNTRLSSTSLARLPLTCAIRRSIRLGLARYRVPLSVLILGVFAALYVRARYRAHRATLARVPALVDVVLARLTAQKERWLYEDVDEPVNDGDADGGDADESFQHDPFLFLPHLRDDVLRSTHSLAARERIWKHVRAVVEQNSNVRTGQREGHNGEVGRAWEWIGPVGTGTSTVGGGGVGGTVEMSAVRRRRSGRPSLRPGSGGGGAQRRMRPDWTTHEEKTGKTVLPDF